MSKTISPAGWEIVGLGILAGMRTSAAPAIVSNLLSSKPSNRLKNGRLSFIQSRAINKLFTLGAVAEFIVDKLPATPNRIKPGGVIFRSAAGGLAGACMSEARGEKPARGAIVGAAVACAATFGSFYLRKAVVKKTGIYDPLIGTIEDIVVAATYAYLTKSILTKRR